MSSLHRVLTFVLTSFAFASLAFAAGPDINGKWAAEFDTEVGVQKYVFEFKVEDGKVTGRADSNLSKSEIKDGKLEGDVLTFTETLTFEGVPLTVTYKGKVEGDEIKFTRNVGEYATETFVAKRVKAPAPAAPAL
jgi:hypothetical protein